MRELSIEAKISFLVLFLDLAGIGFGMGGYALRSGIGEEEGLPKYGWGAAETFLVCCIVKFEY